MFVDTSAVVVILCDEPEAVELLQWLDEAAARYVSALVVLEATMRLSIMLASKPLAVEALVERFLAEMKIELAPVDLAAARLAAAAFARYGKGRGHLA